MSLEATWNHEFFSHDTPFHIGQLENAVRTVLRTLTTHQFQT